MQKIIRLTLLGVTTIFLQLSSCFAKEQKPILVIAPDLIIESCQVGKFRCDLSPTRVPISKVQFTPSDVSDGGCYGYRIKLRTTRKQVKISEEFELFKEKSVGRLETPVDGIIYRDWDDAGLHKGPHTVKVWVDDIELPTLHYTRK
jgi:hypothetical protein